jgi:hypothetical protein
MIECRSNLQLRNVKKNQPMSKMVQPQLKSSSWKDFFDLVDALDLPDDFLQEREDSSPQERQSIHPKHLKRSQGVATAKRPLRSG